MEHAGAVVVRAFLVVGWRSGVVVGHWLQQCSVHNCRWERCTWDGRWADR